MAFQPPASKPEADMETNIKMINEMGWTAADAQEALTVAEGNLQGAVNWLLTHAPQGVLVKPAKSPEQVKEAPKSANTSGGAVNIPPPPLDSSDVEDARHLEAMKRNYSTEYVPGHPALQGRTNSGSQEPSPSTSSPAAQPAPSSQNNSTADSSNMVGSNNSAGFTSTVMEKAPKVLVCYEGTADKVQLKEAEELMKLLSKEHIPCALVDITKSEDSNLADTIYSISMVLPQAILLYQPFGDLQGFHDQLSSLRRHIAQRIAEGLHAEHTSNLDVYRSNADSTGAVDKVATFIHSMLGRSGISSSSSRETNNFIEFTVMKTNWYLRSQLRRIRFGTAGEFFRFDPTSGDLRESVRYSDIKSIKVGAGTLSLAIANGTLHNFSAPPLVIDYMFQLFLAYAPESVTPEFSP